MQKETGVEKYRRKPLPPPQLCAQYGTWRRASSFSPQLHTYWALLLFHLLGQGPGHGFAQSSSLRGGWVRPALLVPKRCRAWERVAGTLRGCRILPYLCSPAFYLSAEKHRRIRVPGRLMTREMWKKPPSPLDPPVPGMGQGDLWGPSS